MSDQADAANAFARGKAGAAVDGGKTPPGVRVMGTEPEGGGDRIPWVKLPGPGRPLSNFAIDVGNIIAGGEFFRRDRVGCTVNPTTGMMEEMSAERFRTFAEEYLVTHKEKVVEGEVVQVPTTMTVDASRGTLASDLFVYRQREIDRVNMVRMPVRRADGRLELLPDGYDEEARTFTMPTDVVIDETLDLKAGRAILHDLLKEFPWGDVDPETGMSRSRAVAVAAMVAMFGAGLQALTAKRMNFVYTSNSQGGGKSLLAQFAVIPVTGMANIQAMPDAREELRKLLETEALSASPYIFFDNLEGNVRNHTLEAFMTASVWTGRMLGGQKKFTAPKVSIVFMTGNNLTLSTDIARRVLMCDLYVEEADIQARRIDRVIDEAYLAKPEVRGDILSALWALVRAWDQAGRPPASRVIRGFEEWSAMFGGIVEFCGFGNPLEAPKLDNAGDQETEDMKALIEVLAEELDAREVTTEEYEFDELIERCLANECFTWMIEAKRKEKESESWWECTPKTKSIMGKLFAGRFGGRVFVIADGRRLRFGTRGRNRQRRYQVSVM